MECAARQEYILAQVQFGDVRFNFSKTETSLISFPTRTLNIMRESEMKLVLNLCNFYQLYK